MTALRHLAGLALAVALGLAGYGVIQTVPRLVAGTVLRDLYMVIGFVVIIGLLSLAEIAWLWIAPRLGRPPDGH